ncbi:hypothetical protein HZH66_004790 [Vespula vulgaris]|uniref:Uncharacterized protein n=1 Tax=Vespula vulgaris TaxID=7454 RepID=A0A834K9G6_VESVU|nr:hypothetical protein HZH66_004790 [Vespula vulgaris]
MESAGPNQRDIRKGQLNRSAMEEPRPGGTAFLITVSPAPGKDIRKGQLNRSAMEEPRPGGTAFLITVTSAPGKYAFSPLNTVLEYNYVTFCCGNIFDYAQHSG